ncbi:type-F conjugative transfer system secretin TraK [Novosphingobium album (ex Liu et al. 2023)]|uniref:Type-F conjugative transfer system secretin TraK n=1 Tax=Novosphingobium album (ex Liu et al. 2023) TaxID=3031130 RepID=A0ABT5WX62_9SPHN|nr:type-F conjugative transfer system secretin TraK [Novosphingobium album (ex Liu et al. 2023)]MDE8654457.1 type-F conjugative transfer system secretin TraK [Novosphingobium album (ex Liu et al. 2023)]
MAKTADRAPTARACLHGLIASIMLTGTGASLAQAQTQAGAQSFSTSAITALPDQTSAIRLSNRDVNHVICVGGEIEDVKFSAEKAIAVEKAGSDAWIKFLVRESDDAGQVTRSYVTVPSEFFISCNGAIYPLYAEPSNIPAQTVTLAPGKAQRAKANDDLLGPLVEEERAVSVTLAMLQDRIPASFTVVAPRLGTIPLTGLPAAYVSERRRVAIEGSGLSASEYRVDVTADTMIDERAFLDRTLGARIFAVSADRLSLKAGEAARVIVVRRETGE